MIEQIPETMRAVVFDDYGDASVLHLQDVATPTPTDQEVLIQVRAAGVNPIDARLRSGEARFLIPGGFPRIPGYDVAGDILVAPEDSGFQRGDRVLAFLDNIRGGAYAEFAVCDVSAAATIPAQLSYREAAAIPLAGSTAYQALVHKAALTSDMTVLVNGASGGVGSFAVEIAVDRGAEVTAVASGDHEDYVRSLGAQHFLDYESTDFTSSGRQWDVIFDVAGKSSYGQAKNSLTENGQYISTEPDLQGFVETFVTVPFKKRGKVVMARPSAQDLRSLVELCRRGKLKVVIDSVFSIEDAGSAHRRLEAGVDHGKVVINVSEDGGPPTI